jgi:hypothetical protein
MLACRGAVPGADAGIAGAGNDVMPVVGGAGRAEPES